MGKLHHIRRKIEKDPGKWFGVSIKQPYRDPFLLTYFITHRGYGRLTTRVPIATIYGAGKFSWSIGWTPYITRANSPYQEFVAHVLKDLGYIEDGPTKDKTWLPTRKGLVLKDMLGIAGW
jgi:hypothetical protein